MDDWLFVYGTLRHAIDSPMALLLKQKAVYCGKAFMQGQLFLVADYPGVCESAQTEDKVLGDLYHIRHPYTLFAHLDAYEECTSDFPQPHEYIRKQVPVMREDGEQLLAWCYLYNLETSGLKRIYSGDFLGLT